MTDCWEETLAAAGWKIIETKFTRDFAYVVHKATGQMMYIEFQNDEEDPTSLEFQIVRALTSKVIKRGKVMS